MCGFCLRKKMQYSRDWWTIFSLFLIIVLQVIFKHFSVLRLNSLYLDWKLLGACQNKLVLSSFLDSAFLYFVNSNVCWYHFTKQILSMKNQITFLQNVIWNLKHSLKFYKSYYSMHFSCFCKEKQLFKWFFFRLGTRGSRDIP